MTGNKAIGCTGKDFTSTKLCTDCELLGCYEACFTMIHELNRIMLFNGPDVVQERIDLWEKS